jgi:hypothetical protein
LSGDFVPAIAVDPTTGTIWAATQSTGISEAQLRDQGFQYFPEDGVQDSLDWDIDRDGRIDLPGSNGISWSSDGGGTWQSYVPESDPNLRRTFRAWNFTFGDSKVWIAGSYSSYDALFMSPNGGATWQVVPIVTSDGITVVTQDGTGDVCYANGVLWAATGRGLVRSANGGATWDFVLTYPQANPLHGGSPIEPTGRVAGLDTYAFPSPSAPILGNPPNIVYALAAPADVTVRIYDAGSRLVRTIRLSGMSSGNHTISWDGLNDEGSVVANGVYIYEIKTSDGHSAIGKLMVLN